MPHPNRMSWCLDRRPATAVRSRLAIPSISPIGIWRRSQDWLVLFPSRLDHSVLANGDPELLRCSISFDFVLTAPVDGDPPEYLAPHPSVWTPQPLEVN